MNSVVTSPKELREHPNPEIIEVIELVDEYSVWFLGDELPFCVNLERLTLRGCSFPLRLFEFIPDSVRVLEIIDDGYREIPIDVVGLVNLEELNFSRNLIEEIPDYFREFWTLKKVNLSGNNITNVPEFIFDLPLIELGLNMNQLTSFPNVKCETLKTLYLNGNTNIDEDTIRSQFPTLEELTI